MGYASSGALSGATSGATAGFALGGHVGAGIGFVLGGLGGFFSGDETDRRNDAIRSSIYDQIGDYEKKRPEIDEYYAGILQSAEREDALETQGLFDKFMGESNSIRSRSEQEITESDIAMHGTANKRHSQGIKTLQDWMNLSRETQKNKYATNIAEINMAKDEAHDELDNVITSLRTQAMGL